LPKGHGHTLSATQFLERQSFVLHRQFVAAFALAVELFQDLRGGTEGPTDGATK
jgi:hypothetical protein